MAAIKARLKQGDTKQFIGTCLMDGLATSIAGATVRFHLSQSDLTLIYDLAATNLEDSNASLVGKASCTLTPDQTAALEPGDYLIEWEVTWPNGDIQTFPNDGWSAATCYEQLA